MPAAVKAPPDSRQGVARASALCEIASLARELAPLAPGCGKGEKGALERAQAIAGRLEKLFEEERKASIACGGASKAEREFVHDLRGKATVVIMYSELLGFGDADASELLGNFARGITDFAEEAKKLAPGAAFSGLAAR
jgi:hypothetical protein